MTSGSTPYTSNNMFDGVAAPPVLALEGLPAGLASLAPPDSAGGLAPPIVELSLLHREILNFLPN